jgi:hypothetical protein
MTVLDRAPVAGDPGLVARDRQCPDPEVPERARRRTFTARYKWRAQTRGINNDGRPYEHYSAAAVKLR